MAETELKLKQSVALVGMMGAGKTAIGRALASRLNVPFVDSDAAIEEASGQTIAEIFESDGEAFFRQRETEVIARLMRQGPAIVSTGGGAFLREANREIISQNGVALWLDADLDLLWSRVKRKDTRPLLRTADPYNTLKTLYEDRIPVYALAEFSVTSLPEYSIEDMTDAVLETLTSHPEIVETDHA